MSIFIGLSIVLVFIIVVVIGIKKSNQINNDLVSGLTDEEKLKLKENQIEDFDEENMRWVQRGMIGEVKDKGNKVRLRVLYYETVINNNFINTITYCDTVMKKEEFEKKGLKKGSFVKIMIDVKKCEAKII